MADSIIYNYEDFQKYFLLCDKTMETISQWANKSDSQNEAIANLLEKNKDLLTALDDGNVVIPDKAPYQKDQLREALTTLKDQLSKRLPSPRYS